MSADAARRPRVSRAVVEIVAAVVVLALVAAALLVLLPRTEKHTMTVSFDRTVSLYEGSNVRILGVDVGTVDTITPRGDHVQVRISWDAEYDLPADVQAVIVSPSVVGDRFVQLTPAYSGGATLDDGAHLDQTRTATPTELDATFEAIDRVATALGPDGANADGELSRLLSSTADNLDGKGEEIRRSIAALAKLTTTADGSKDELFGSMEKIETFVSALETNDASVRSFNTSLAQVSEVLAGERTDLQGALRELASTLGQIQSYVNENRGALRTNVKGLQDVTENLAGQRRHLAKMLENGPEALSNLAATYNPTNGTIDARGTIKRRDDGRFIQLTDSVYVSAYCGLAIAEDVRYREACLAMREVVDWMELQVKGGGSAAETPDEAPADEAAAPAPDGLAALMGVA